MCLLISQKRLFFPRLVGQHICQKMNAPLVERENDDDDEEEGVLLSSPPPPPLPVLTHGLIPLNASDGGIEANEMRIKYYQMSSLDQKSDDAVSIQSVSRADKGTRADGDEEMLENNNNNVCGNALVSHDDDDDDDDDDISKLKMITTTTKRVLVLDDDNSTEEEEEENVQKIKKKKKKPFETERTSMKDDDGHCGFGVPGFVEKQPKMVPKQHRELNSIIDNQSVLTANRRDHFTPFASNLHNKILLKRICIKAGNNARFFLSKTSKAFRKVTLREFGVMTSSNIEQGRVKAVKISEIETPAQFVLCVEHGLQLNDLVFAALADGGQLNVLKYLHDHLLPDKMYHCSLAVEYAAQNNHLETLKYLIEYHDAPVCKDACWRAAWKGSLECLEYLVLVRRCPFDRQECHDIAYQNGHFETAKWIKER